MSTVSAKVTVPYATHAAETLWYDTDRWPGFVDGFNAVKAVEGGWPRTGSTLVWETKVGGRGTVTESVTRYEARSTCVSTVEDDHLTGTQTVLFTPTTNGTTVQLKLEYRILKRTPFTPVVDLLFVRAQQRQSLQRTLHRFSLELRDEISPPA